MEYDIAKATNGLLADHADIFHGVLSECSDMDDEYMIDELTSALEGEEVVADYALAVRVAHHFVKDCGRKIKGSA